MLATQEASHLLRRKAKMTYNLWIDDMRDPEDFLFRSRDGEMAFPDFRRYLTIGFGPNDFVWCKTAEKAIRYVKNFGPPKFLALDHDLGDHDIFEFLNWFSKTYPKDCPEFFAHSANPCGRDNINSFMNSWKKSLSS